MMADTMQCFFFGTSFGQQVAGHQFGLAGFAIPDLGVIFRSRWTGTLYECQYAGLLSLLQFAESNQKSLGQFQLEVLSDSAIVVYQIAHKKFISKELEPFYNCAMNFKKKVDYRISWVPRHENVAIAGMASTPPLNPDIKIDFEINGLNDNSSGSISLSGR
jgi:hypothetical protein